MYKQFSHVNFIQTNERNHKILFNTHSKLPSLNIKNYTNNSKLLPINIQNSNKVFNQIYNKTRQKNWRPFHKTRKYFSKPYYLISTE